METVLKNYTISEIDAEDLELFKTIFDHSELRSEFIGKPDHYVRVRGFRYWDLSTIEEYENKALDFNSKSKNIKIEITGYEDSEIEWDNDRSYPAAFCLMIKSNNKDNYITR